MSDPDTGRGIPEQERFSSRDEEQEFEVTSFDPTVKQALDTMAHHADVLEGERVSVVDRLIDELLAEQKKDQPDPERLADIRRRLQTEHPLIAVQTVTNETALQYMADIMETTELNDREAAVSEIVRLIPAITGLEKDIADMADEAIGETVEEYPDEMEMIINDAAETKERSIKEICEYLEIEPAEEFPKTILNTKELLQVNFEKLKSVFAALYNAQSEMLDYQADMAEVVKAWKEEHHQGS